MTRVRVRFLPAVPPTRGPGLGDSDLWAIKDIQASLGPENWERAAVPKSRGVSRATCAHLTAVLGQAATTPRDGHLDPSQPCPRVSVIHRDFGHESGRDSRSCPQLRA